jgi:hypothetical protein
MLVFAVLVDVDKQIEERTDARGRHRVVTVVQETERQIPLAVLSFGGAEKSYEQRSFDIAEVAAQAVASAEVAESRAAAAKVASRVIQLIIRQGICEASDVYRSQMTDHDDGTEMPPRWAAELVPYVRDIDPRVVTVLFPGVIKDSCTLLAGPVPGARAGAAANPFAAGSLEEIEADADAKRRRAQWLVAQARSHRESTDSKATHVSLGQPKISKEEEEANYQMFEAAQAKHVAKQVAGDYAGAKVLFEKV